MFKDVFSEIADYLESHSGEVDDRFTFRKRSGHIWRVFNWVKRLIEGYEESIDRDALLIAALFHDIGYALSVQDHANHSALIFRDYAAANEKYDRKRTDFIEYLISNHSKKEMLALTDIPLELIILLEADMLDETGALGIVWDCMMAGSQPVADYTETFQKIKSHAGNILDMNPMRTAKGKEFWEQKQILTNKFLKQLEYDLALNE